METTGEITMVSLPVGGVSVRASTTCDYLTAKTTRLGFLATQWSSKCGAPFSIFVFGQIESLSSELIRVSPVEFNLIRTYRNSLNVEGKAIAIRDFYIYPQIYFDIYPFRRVDFGHRLHRKILILLRDHGVPPSCESSELNLAV
jgi:hypothetical protein